ncbi:MAG: DUF4132 domain-containing protein [Clostridiales Family XIII bacterium]|jgi:hypothetical protein|nr:DUF4132 domain-containing protein [Clostridiales Family XIII bacterium]
MDQMIRQISGYCDSFSNEDKEVLASYLVGQIPLEQVKKLLSQIKTKNNFYYSGVYEDTREIAAECKKNPQLLPRLGRHMQVLALIGDKTYDRVLELLVETLTPIQVFIESGIGIQQLLDWQFRTELDENAEILELAWQKYPADLQDFIKNARPGQRMPALAFWCAKQGLEPFSGAGKKSILPFAKKDDWFRLQFAEDLAYGFRSFWQAPPEDDEIPVVRDEDFVLAFWKSVETHCPDAAGTLPQKAKEHEEKKPDKQKRKELIEQSKIAPGSLMRALILSLSLKDVRALARAACETHYPRFVEAYYLASVKGKKLEVRLTQESYLGASAAEAAEAQILDLRAAFEKHGFPLPCLCAWAARQRLAVSALWAEPWEKLFARDTALLKQAAEIAGAPEKLLLYRQIYEGQGAFPDDALPQCRAAMYTQFAGYLKNKDIDALAAWMLREEDARGVSVQEENAEIAVLPDLSADFLDKFTVYKLKLLKNRIFDVSMLLLTGFHPAAGRYIRYIAARRLHYLLEKAAFFQLNWLCRLPAQTAAFFLEQAADPGDLIYCVAKSCGTEEYGADKKGLRVLLEELASARPAAAADILERHEDASARLCILEAIYSRIPDYDSDFLIKCLSDKSKKVRQYALSFLLPRKELADKIRPLTDAKKKDLREAAEQLMAAYESESAGGAETDIVALCTRNLPKSGTASIKWAFPADLPQIRWRDSDGTAEAVVVSCYLTLLLGSKTVDLPPLAPKLRAVLREEDLRGVAAQVYGNWLADGAAAKYRGALLLYGLHAGDAEVMVLRKQIDDWAEHARGAIAAEAARAMALGGSDLALMTVDNIGRKFKNKQVRAAAVDAFSAAAAALGTTAEALGDRIIPDLGFGPRGEKTIDYGTRKFTAVLSPALAVTLKDESGKEIKALPKPGAKDDASLAEAAKTEFSVLKKTLKTVVDTQRQRLEQALATGRYWNRAAWEKLFVQNPIMHSFAIGLIWGVFADGQLKNTFRYMEDGGFTDVEEDAYDFAGDDSGEIGLVHPLDMDESLLARWKQQLADYEILQPVDQLGRGVYLITEEEKQAQALDRFGGKKLLGITLANKLLKAGWYRGSVQDAGGYYTFYRETGEIGVQLYMSGLYVGYAEPDETVTVGQVIFYRAGSVARGSYVYDDVSADNLIPPADVSPRMFSETVLALTAATATSTEDVTGWQSDSTLIYGGQ